MIPDYKYLKSAEGNLHLRALSRKKVVENLYAGAFLETKLRRTCLITLQAGLSFGLEPSTS